MTDLAATHPELEFEQHRIELTAHCYRMLGSATEAEDAVQDALVRAWRAADGFEGRSSVRSWLYSIATNVCLDMLRSRKRRATPMDLQGPSTADDRNLATLPESTWLEPMPDGRVLRSEGDPAELAIARESVRLAFVAALQHLPARQRAVLLLRDVLRWRASEVAELLDTSEAAVNSALQRAHATLGAIDLTQGPSEPAGVEEQELLAKYVDAFERYDVEALVELMHEDARMAMPPFALWLRGRVEIGKWFLGMGADCRGSVLVRVAANGTTGIAQYRNGGKDPWSIQIPTIRDGKIESLDMFIGEDHFLRFGLPLDLTV
ncbi:MAG TPA: sigma-70 family RNA polymerase sigma factor [Acidimicrobiales bacterium]|nr:sigma-70 family RNA polymerase sigma factor [Acidimicrobiales bacterium]